jgi:hypothetical protein
MRLEFDFPGSFDQELDVARLNLPIGEGGVMPGSPSGVPNPNFKKTHFRHASCNFNMNPSTLSITLKFLKWQPLYVDEKPFQIFINIPPSALDQRTTNLVFENITLPVHDIRFLPLPPTLDSHGFTYIKQKTSVKNFLSRENVDKYYLPDIEALLRMEVEGVDRVFFFDWRVSQPCFSVQVNMEIWS